jgi:hypothetical protein
MHFPDPEREPTQNPIFKIPKSSIGPADIVTGNHPDGYHQKPKSIANHFLKLILLHKNSFRRSCIGNSESGIADTTI